MDLISFANQVLQEIANKKEAYQNNLINSSFETIAESHRASGILYGLVFAESAIRETAQKWKEGVATQTPVRVPTEKIDASIPAPEAVQDVTVEVVND
jgi:hypothetical protein